MTDVLKADIFFVVSTIAVVTVAVFVIIALIYVIRILSDASAISRRAREESEAIISNVSVIRRKIINYILGSLTQKKKKNEKTNSKESNDNQ